MTYMDAIKRPFTNIKNLVIGIIIMAIPIVNFLGIGYVLNCASTSMRRKYALPEWGDWWNLFVRGIVTLVIAIIYMIPIFLVGLLLLGPAFITAITAYSEAGSIAAALTGLTALGMGLIVTAIVAVIISVFTSGAMMNFVSKNYKFSAAFEFSKIAKKAFTGTFFAAWLFSIVYAVIVMIVLGFIPIVGIFIANFVVAVTVYTILGEAFKKA